MTQSDSTADLLRLAGDMLDVGILSVDPEMRVLTWNSWLERASGIKASAAVGQPLASIGEELITHSGELAFQRALSGGTVVVSHRLHGWLLRLPPPAGQTAYTYMQQSARIAPLTSGDGVVSGAVAFIEDVTERVAAEDDLRKATQLAQAANKAKSEFLAAMSHELRTPIGAVSGYADLLLEGIVGEVDEAQRSHLMRIKTIGNHLLRVVDEILTFARLEARVEAPDYKRLDAGQVVRVAASAVEPQALKKRLTLSVGAPDDAVMVETDETKLKQILINLLGNAVKFTERGGVRADIALSSDGTQVVLRVSDTGRGIAKADQDRIFEPFVQAKGAHSRPFEGTGLGLSVSRELARLLGGDLTVSSEPGIGSVFTVTLPLVREPKQS